MITTQSGNEVMPIEAITDCESGKVVACFARRKIDNQKRFYRLHQLRAPGGIAEIVAELEAVPKRRDDELPDHETW